MSITVEFPRIPIHGTQVPVIEFVSHSMQNRYAIRIWPNHMQQCLVNGMVLLNGRERDRLWARTGSTTYSMHLAVSLLQSQVRAVLGASPEERPDAERELRDAVTGFNETSQVGS